VKIRYCDGASFSGNVQEEVKVCLPSIRFTPRSHIWICVFFSSQTSRLICDPSQNDTGFFFRGQRIWEAVMAELLSKGLARAKQVCLSNKIAAFVAILLGIHHQCIDLACLCIPRPAMRLEHTEKVHSQSKTVNVTKTTL
jgi:hypothetical protein